MADRSRHSKAALQLSLLSQALDAGRLGPVRRMINTLSAAEIGNLLESLPPAKREVVWGLVDPEVDGEVLVHVGDEVRESLIADMGSGISVSSSCGTGRRTGSAWNRCCRPPRTPPGA